MDRAASILDLKKRLQKEVARFYRSDKRLWKEPIVRTLRELRKTDVQSVFFGGTLRSLLLSRIYANKFGRPRDVDIVITGATIEALRDQFEAIVSRETRFGGLQLRRREWQFDLWPLHQTWAFVRDKVSEPEFSELPRTTFFNMESIAVEVWAQPGCARKVFSGDDQFFEGILNQTLEINREENPYPELCVLRALIMASTLDFAIGPRLATYIAKHGEHLTENDLEYVQHKHYGQRRQCGDTLREWIATISDSIGKTDGSVRLPVVRQLSFWPDVAQNTRITIHASVD